MAQTSVIKCNLCDVNTALYFCRECASALCSQCRTTHDKLPSLKNHSVTDAKGIDRTAFTSATQCKIHKQQYILYCKKCEILICSKCVSGDHNGHITADTDAVVGDLREYVTTKAAEVKTKEKGVFRKLHEKAEVQQTLTKDAQTFISDMKTTTEEIINIIKYRQSIKVWQVEDSKELCIKALHKNTTKLKKICTDHTAVHDRLNKLLTETHGISFLHSFHILQKEIKDLDDAMIDENFQMEQIPKYNIKIFLEELLEQIASKFQLRLQNIDLKPQKGDELEQEMKESQQGIDLNKESWAAYPKSVTDISNGACMGCGVYGSDGITYNKTNKMPNISQPQLQYILECIKHDNTISLTSVELGDMKFIYIRELDDGRNVHVFKKFKDRDPESENKLELANCMLYLQSSKKVTIIALSESHKILGKAGLNRMNDIIQFFKTSVW
ncbi:E3 ubiquitin-protein ligase TRIM71-like [Mytilus californianus]|uniref:E3 ubiquitin-protein ligase TRIM71-like n=1 Tax=Mytilus californianus TaxID=6549 RepID=UPI002247993E|nr:E3 ubiquitin-protein ligase TRIM71-like [Mytilus californianus]